MSIIQLRSTMNVGHPVTMALLHLDECFTAEFLPAFCLEVSKESTRYLVHVIFTMVAKLMTVHVL